MLKAFREHLKSKRIQWVLWLTIATFIVAIFAVWGGGTQGTGSATSAVGRKSREPGSRGDAPAAGEHARPLRRTLAP